MKLPGNNKGASIVIFAVVIAVVAAFSALAMDIGVTVTEKAVLSTAVDAAALAGAQELVIETGNARSVAENYLAKNELGIKDVSVIINSGERTIEVSGTKTVKNFFARTFNKNSQDISSLAKARIENIKSMSGCRPFAIVQQKFVYGKLYTLKEGAGDGINGNYAALALGGNGGSVYRNNMLDGYSGTISVGDKILTETGNISGTTETSIKELIQRCSHSPACTYNSYNKHCPRIIFIPVVDTLELNGKKFVKVLGFGTFFLEGVTNSGGHADVTGRFITYNMQGETSNEIGDFGTYGIKLIK